MAGELCKFFGLESRAFAAGFPVDRIRAEADARRLIAQHLPGLAAAVGQRFGEVKVVQMGEGNPFGSVAQAIASVLTLVKE